MIVNLTGENSPELSVDRKRLVVSERNNKMLTQVLSNATHVFAQHEGPTVTFDWLCEFAEEHSIVARKVCQIT